MSLRSTSTCLSWGFTTRTKLFSKNIQPWIPRSLSHLTLWPALNSPTSCMGPAVGFVLWVTTTTRMGPEEDVLSPISLTPLREEEASWRTARTTSTTTVWVFSLVLICQPTIVTAAIAWRGNRLNLTSGTAIQVFLLLLRLQDKRGGRYGTMPEMLKFVWAVWTDSTRRQLHKVYEMQEMFERDHSDRWNLYRFSHRQQWYRLNWNNSHE